MPRRKTMSCRGRPIKSSTISKAVDKLKRAEQRHRKAEADVEYYKAAVKHSQACAKSRDDD